MSSSALGSCDVTGLGPTALVKVLRATLHDIIIDLCLHLQYKVSQKS